MMAELTVGGGGDEGRMEPEEKGAGSVREAGKERSGSKIPKEEQPKNCIKFCNLTRAKRRGPAKKGRKPDKIFILFFYKCMLKDFLPCLNKVINSIQQGTRK